VHFIGEESNEYHHKQEHGHRTQQHAYLGPEPNNNALGGFLDPFDFTASFSLTANLPFSHLLHNFFVLAKLRLKVRRKLLHAASYL
jgi:hypothetical protein